MIDKYLLAEELWWEIRRLGFDPEDEHIASLVLVAYEHGIEDTIDD